MDFSEGESRILRRFAEKCHIAGGPQVGYGLRRQSIEYGLPDSARTATTEGLETLVGRGLLVANESGDRYLLTEAGVAALAAAAG